ncbi:hypothetical protein [Nocardia sp. NPDC051570]|uniref:hypothetical protein n=1 Tax=Nocardia sp. NPDC051570 TaxID=3364324 RepID=UPI00379E358E
MAGARAAAAGVLIPVAVFYLGPRMYELVAMPYRLDRAVVSASHYNPALNEIVDNEKRTLTAFDALAEAEAALKSVLVTDATVAAELDELIGRITGDLQAVLDSAATNVSALITALRTLSASVGGLQNPARGATTALAADRATLAAVLDDVRRTAASVHSARVSAESAARDLDGQ